MSRTRKTDEDRELNAFIGSRVQAFRLDAELKLETLSKKLGISAPHLKSLESGRYSFSASIMCKLAASLGRKVEAFLPKGPQRPIDPGRREWETLYEMLTSRDRTAVIQLGRTLSGHAGLSLLQTWKRLAVSTGCLISLEGIDGVVLNGLGESLMTRIKSAGKVGVASAYDFDSALWQFMVERFKTIAPDPVHAFERTLLYACERLSRQEQQIRPSLQQGAIVVTRFYALASVAYQHLEQLNDTTLLDAVDGFLLEPDLVVLVDSDPAVAAQRAVPHRPGPNEFYSPYTGVAAFEEAVKQNEEAAQALQQRAVPVLRVRYEENPDDLADAIMARLPQSSQ
jgi:dTMP kinase